MLDFLRALPLARPGWVVGLLVAAFVVWVVGCRLRGTAHRRVTVVLLTLGCVFGLAGGADAANIYFGYLPRTSDLVGVGAWNDVRPRAVLAGNAGSAATPTDRSRQEGGVLTLALPGPVSGFGTQDAKVWLPPQYFTQPHRRFGVLYLVHGSPGVPLDWLRGGRAAQAGLAAARAGDPLIIVMPKASRWWLDDSECVDGRQEHIDTYLSTDVVRDVDGMLRTIPDRGQRAIGGMSAGGFCALNVGLRHRDVYSEIVDMSGLTVPTHAGGLSELFGTGPGARAAEQANTPAYYASRLSPRPTMAVWMDTGDADTLILHQMRVMAGTLRRDGFDVRLGTRPGAHTFHVWAPALQDSLPWVYTHFQPTGR